MHHLVAGKFNIIIGGQAGSESKGKLSGWLCDRDAPDLLVMTASPNAGHTIVTSDGVKHVSYHLPIGATMCDCPIVLTAASVINLEILAREIRDLGINPRRVIIDPRASIITDRHLQAEAEGKMSDIGSTLQGIGACRIEKLRRKRSAVLIGNVEVPDSIGVQVYHQETSRIIDHFLGDYAKVLCESTQGFDLDLEHGIDPVYCTSKMINPAMIMAEAGVSPKLVGTIFGVIRPYPIRVNNRTGTSGPYTGSEEISWQQVAEECGYTGDPALFGEITTTTKLPRRVFTFSWDRFQHFIRVCRPDSLCLQFANYVDWNVFRTMKITDRVREFIRDLEIRGGVPVDFVGTGPEHQWMVEIEEDVQ